MSIAESMNLVFASGVLIPQMLAGQDYFRGVRTAYPHALIPDVPVLGSIRQRAQSLADAIRQRFPQGPIHIVAHSMGGLDSRYLICENLNGLASRIVSLSTLCTPHLGTPIADFIVAPRPDVSNLAEHVLYETISETMRVLGWPSGAASDLTTVSAKKFTTGNPDRSGTRYFAYAAVGLESFVLKPLHAYMEMVARTPDEKKNDGTVSLASAMRHGLEEPPWPTDHYGVVGHNFNRPGFASDFDHLSAIARVVQKCGAANPGCSRAF